VQAVRNGQLFYIPIGTSHVFRPVSSDLSKHPLIVYNCVFSQRLLMKLGEFASDTAIRKFISSINEGSVPSFSLFDAGDSFEKLFIQLHREFSLPREGSGDYLYILLLQLLIIVYRMKKESGFPIPPSSRPYNLTAFEQLLTYLEQNLAEDLSLRGLSQISRWSERHLQRLFKQHTEQTFNRYLQSIRIRRSCELLRTTSYKISTIAEMSGYKDISSFLAVFKRNVGATPSAYRKSVSS
jgi:AraC family L-rhamnose operon transcriptional activator RhaR